MSTWFQRRGAGDLVATARQLDLKSSGMLFAGLASALGALALLLAHRGIFLGTRLVPYDAITDYYPWYVNALRSFRDGIFVSLNPFKLGGMPNFHLTSNYDYLYWLPLLAGGVPGIRVHQVMNQAHLLLVPGSLTWVAYLHGGRGSRLLGPAALGVVAALMGPALIYQQHVNAVDSYALSFVALALFETFAASGAAWAAVLFAVTLAFSFMRFSTSAVFWPLFYLPYAFFRAREGGHLSRLGPLALAGLIGGLTLLPYLVQAKHMWEVVTASEGLRVHNTLVPSELWSLLGLPRHPDSLIGVPSLLLALLALSLRRMARGAAVFLAAFVVLGILYSFAQLTPFCDLFRAVYVPAAFFRRPYAMLYVVFAVMAFAVAREWERIWEGISRGVAVTLAGTLVAACIGYLSIESSRPWRAVILGLLALSLVLPFRRRTAVTGALLLQWAMLVYQPFARSHWFEKPASELAAVLAGLESMRPILATQRSSSEQLYRVVSAGLPAGFGAYSSVYEYYNLAPDYSTLFPRTLVDEVGIKAAHAAEIGRFIEGEPSIIGSSALRRLAVRYYVLAPDLFARMEGQLGRYQRGLRRLALDPYWVVLEDSSRLPFVHAVNGSGAVGEVAAAVTRGRLTFRVPADAVALRVAFIHDSWWRLTVTGSGRDASGLVRDDHGQLVMDSRALRGEQVELWYGSSAFDAAVVLSLVAHAAVLLVLAASVASRVRMRFLRKEGAIG